MKKCFEAIFIKYYVSMQMKVIITFCPHSSSSNVLEAKTFSTFSWAIMEHEASSTNQI